MNTRRLLSFLAVSAIVVIIGLLAYSSGPWQSSGQDLEPGVGTSASDLPIGMLDSVAPSPGQPAPDFVLPRADGSNVRLSDFRGTPVFLNFWASWCPFCLEEMPDMERVHQEFGDDLVIVGVNNGDSVSDGQELAGELGVTYELLYDPDLLVVEGYRIQAMPTSYFIDADGLIVDFQFGFMTYEQMLEKVSSLTAIEG